MIYLASYQAMRFRFIFILFFVSTFFCFHTQVSAQGRGADNRPNDKKDDDSVSLTEMRSKWRIKAEQKRYEELVARGAEAAKLSDELNKTFTQNRQISRQETEKLLRLEKLSKKILVTLGGDNDDHDGKDPEDYQDETPKNLEDAFKKLAGLSADLLENLKKLTRHAISAQSITDTNDLLQTIAFIRQTGNIQTNLR